MGRRSFMPEFKHETVKLVLERGMTKSQAAQDFGLHVIVLRKWVQDAMANGAAAFPGRGPGHLSGLVVDGRGSQ